MIMDHLTNPMTLAVLLLLALAFVRLGVWWALIRTVLGTLLRPAGLVVVAVAVAAVMQLG